MRQFPRTFLDAILRSADDGGGAGDPGAAAAAASAAVAPAAGDPPAGSVPADPSAAAAPVGLYRPEALPETMLGKSDKETLDNAAKALKGYRDRDATNAIPETKDAYAAFAADVPDVIKPHLETLKADPLFDRIAEKALALRVSVPAYQGLVQEFLSVSQEMGLMEPIVDAQAEKAALLPDTAQHLGPAEQTQAIEQRMNTNFAFLDAMVARGVENGGIAKDDAEFAKAMLGDSAKGHRLFEWMAKTAGGSSGNGPSMATPGGSNGADPKAALTARAALPQNTVGHREFDRASWDALMADYKKVHGG